MSSDEDKKQDGSEQELIRELAAILTESGTTEPSTPGGGTADAGTTTPSSGIDHNVIRELAELLTETGLTEIELDQNGQRVRVARTPGVQSVGLAAPAPVVSAAADSAAPATPEAHAGAVTSPMVGTAYLSPEPGADVFIKEGDMVREGQTLMIVEAMKTMNPIPAPKAGKVTRIVVDDGQPVEYGEALLIIE